MGIAALHPSYGLSSPRTRLCENAHEQRMRRIVFSLFFFRRVTARTVLLLFDVVETNFLRASPKSKFSHSLERGDPYAAASHLERSDRQSSMDSHRAQQ